MKPSATIIGGSIAGLFAANALLKKGWSISIHEKVPTPLSGRGAGIATYNELADLVFKSTGNKKVLGTSAKTRISLDINGNITTQFHYPQVYTSWQYLYSLLRDNIPNENYYMDDDCIKIVQDKNSAISFFNNKKEKQDNLIIIANGIKSELREYVDKDAKPEYAGYVGWRGVVNEDELTEKSLEVLSNYFVVVLPYNQQIAAYPIAGEGKDPFKKGNRRINWIWYKPAPDDILKNLLLGNSGKQYFDGIPPHEIRNKIVNDLFEEAKNKLPPQLSELVLRTSTPLIQPIYDLKSKYMQNSRLLTIGDAAFTARPHVGMGVTKAAMDAHTLSDYLDHDNYLINIKEWETKRIKDGNFIVNRGRDLGKYLSKAIKNTKLIMPENIDVLKDTAISLQDIKDYKNSK